MISKSIITIFVGPIKLLLDYSQTYNFMLEMSSP